MTDRPIRTKGYVLVEGHGEIEAMHNLVTRLGQRVGVRAPWRRPLRWKNLHQIESQASGGVRSGVDWARTRRDLAALLIVRDADEVCPCELAPSVARALADLGAPFPIAYVLLKPEYEVLLLPCLGRMAAIGFPRDLAWDRPNWEARRGVQEWLTGRLPPGRSYKPTVMQLPMTRLIDLDELARADVPCFGTLERALSFLGRCWGTEGGVYPQVTGSSGGR